VRLRKDAYHACLPAFFRATCRDRTTNYFLPAVADIALLPASSSLPCLLFYPHTLCTILTALLHHTHFYTAGHT